MLVGASNTMQHDPIVVIQYSSVARFKNRNNGITVSVFERKNRLAKENFSRTRDVTRLKKRKKEKERILRFSEEEKLGRAYLLSDSRVPRTIFLWAVELSSNPSPVLPRLWRAARRGCLL